MTLTLARITSSSKGTFGVLIFNGEAFAVTIERTYLLPGSSTLALPKFGPGIYPCRRRMFYRGGYETFEIIVPRHTDILFHKANYAKDVDGCVGVGEKFNEFGRVFGSSPGIAESALGFEEFMVLLKGIAAFDLKVVSVVSLVNG